jgi:uncharacterized repeat protein (TIGR01451 family)
MEGGIEGDNGGFPIPGRGWAYGFFVGDANGLFGSFNFETDFSMDHVSGPHPEPGHYLGHLAGMGFVMPAGDTSHFTEMLKGIINEECGRGTADVPGSDVMFWVVHIELDEFIDQLGPWSDWCINWGVIHIVNGTMSGSYEKYDENWGMTFQDSLLHGQYCSDMASRPGAEIPPNHIFPDWVTIKQLPSMADIGIAKDADAVEDEAMVGDSFTYTLTVTNHGPSPATDIQVTDALPAGVNYESDTATQGWYDAMSGIWNVGDLENGEWATLDITVTVTTVGDILNRATITAADVHDENADNDSATATVTGLAPPEVTDADIDLVTGWNLISFPIIPSDGNLIVPPGPQPERDIGNLTAGLNFTNIYWYDPSSGFLGYDGPAGMTDDLLEMYDGLSYWVLMAGNDTLTIAEGWEHVAETDPPSAPPAYPVVSGWNMSGFKSTVPKLPADYYAGIAGKYVMILGFDAATNSFFIVGTPGHEFLMPGEGYWIAILDGESGTVYP